MYHRCLNDRTSQYTSPFTVSHCPARDISVPLSEIYCTYHVTDSTRTAAPGLLSLLVRPTGTVFRTLSAIRTPPKLLSGACLRHFRSHGTSAQRIGEGGLLVMMSVFHRRTLSAPRPINGWQVTTLCMVNCPLWVSQLGQLSLPSLLDRQLSSNPCILHGLRRKRQLKRQTKPIYGYGCKATGQSPWPRAWAAADCLHNSAAQAAYAAIQM